MLHDLGWLKQVKVKNSSGTIINPATNEKLEELKTLLQQIEDAVDDLEIKAENINLNTDDLEAKVQSVRDQLDVLLSTRASEETLQLVLDAIGSGSGTDLLTELQTILASLNTVASEATLIQVRDYLDTVETKLQTIIDKFDVNLSTRASESTLSTVNTKIGEVQVTPTSYTVLGRLKDIWDRLATFLTVKLYDKDANGITSKDEINGSRSLDVNIRSGSVIVAPDISNVTVQILFEKQHTAVNSGEWQEVLEYTVPNDYDLNILAFEGQSQSADEAGRAVFKSILGTFVCDTNTFTDSKTIALPRFATRLYLYVTSTIGSGVDDTFTITYTNALGITGRTATITVIKGSLVGTRLQVNLQTGDYGIIDITNITHTATGQAGEVQLGGYIELLYITLKNTNTQYQSFPIALNGLVIPAGDTIYLQYLSGTKTTYIRRLNLLAALVPRIV